MVCSYRSSCLDLPVVLVDFQMKGCDSCFHHVCQGGYVAMHEIDLDREELKVFVVNVLMSFGWEASLRS